jgi:hypothetical protein
MTPALLLAAAALAAPAPAPQPAPDPAALSRRLAALKEAHASELGAMPQGPVRMALRLRQMKVEDQLTREALMGLPTPEWTGPVGKRIGDIMAANDRANTAELKGLLTQHGWPRRDALGEEADDAAWLIVQHADQDLPFQKRVLALLDAARKDGGTKPEHYAYLYDRVASSEKRPQLYGTQGRCLRAGVWEPNPIANPAELDERRREMGMARHASYVESTGKRCP